MSSSSEARDEARTFLISVAAELAGMHAQTLRQYDRLGLVSPRRSSGGGRRYSQRDVELLREVQRLSQDEGVNLAGIKRVIELTNQDSTPSEFESKTLRVEKVVAGGGKVTLQIRALTPGRYRFFDDYHEDTTEGFLVVK